MSYANLLDAIKQNQIKLDEKRLQTVYDFAAAAHEGQLRQTGDAYITHPLSVAEILVGWRQPQSVIEAALLHDVANCAAAAMPFLLKTCARCLSPWPATSASFLFA